MSEPRHPEHMTDDELQNALDVKYGADASIKSMDPSDPLVVEFASRIARGRL